MTSQINSNIADSASKQPAAQVINLTTRQTEVLQVIRDHIEQTGAPPTRAEIAKKLKFKSVNAAEDHLKALARKGVITLAAGTSRGIQLAKNYGLGLPIIKQLSSEHPVFWEKHFEGRLRIQNEYFTPKPDYLFYMQGISLLGAGIKEGDLLAIHCSEVAKSNQLVVARYKGKTEIRRYTLENNQIVLKAEHPDFEKIMISQEPSDFRIEGIVVGVIRTNGV